MPGLQHFRLPDLGEGLTEAEVLRWLVAPGDVVTLNQVIVEVETAKASVEVPSPYAGVVHRLHARAGELLDVGAPLVTVDTGGDTGGEAGVPPGAPTGQTGPSGRTATLVGYGPRTGAAVRRVRTDRPRPAAPAGAAQPPPATAARISAAAVGRAAEQAATAVRPLAKPPVRRLARDLGVDLARVPGTGPYGSTTRQDVEAAAGKTAARETAARETAARETAARGTAARGTAARGTAAGDPVPGGLVAGSAPTGLPAPGAAGAVGPVPAHTRVPVRGLRRATAAAMVASARVPQVTEFVTADVTASMDLLTRLRALPDYAGVKVSPLLLVARALLVGLRRCPEVNSSWDEPAGEIVLWRDVDLGIAVAGPRGLLVPHIKDAGGLGLVALATALHELAVTAREGRTRPADLVGGTITITNVGVFGIDTGTPLLNPGQSAILCLGAVHERPWALDGAVVLRQVVQLALTFDHRVLDGQAGSRLLSDVARALNDPTLLLAWS